MADGPRAGVHPGIGDDWTDEDLFRALPPTAYSVRVGLANTAARYYLSNHTAVRRVLRELSEVTREQAADVAAGNGPEPQTTILTLMPAANRNREGLDRDPFWYKSGVIYEVHVRAFYDANGDGSGDFRGPDGKAGLHQGPRRDRHLAAAVLSLAAQGRRL